MPHWEYCAVVGVFNMYQNRHLAPKYPAVWYFTTKGIQTMESRAETPKK